MQKSTLASSSSSEAFRNFVNSLDSEESKKHYSKIFRYFMTYCNVDNYEDMLEIEPKRLEGLIRDYIIHLKENKRSSSTINSYIAAITHFYEMNDIVLRWKKLNKFKGKHRSVADDRPYTRSQIKTLLEYAGALRDKCIILLMASAGLRRGALPMLKIQDLTPIDSYKIYKIRVYAREEEEYFTYCTPECRRLLDQYLDWRVRQGETLKPTSPLLRQEFNSLQVHRPVAMTQFSITAFIHRLIEKSGVRPQIPNSKGARTDIMQCHGLRKYFKTTCINAGMHPLYSEYVMGHRSGLTKSYFKPTDQELLEGNDKALGYVAAINDLTINEEYRLAKKVNELQLKNDQIMEMEKQHRKELESVQNQMNQIMAMIRQNPKLANIKHEALAKKVKY
jgi:integrase